MPESTAAAWRAGLLLAGSLLFAAGAVAAQDEGDRDVLIINDTGVTMLEFYASNIDRPDWEENILGKDVLGPGDQMSVIIDDGSGYCLFDLRAVFSDGDEVVEEHFDVCEMGAWRVYD